MQNKKRLLGVYAHCDDEILVAWPFFQVDAFEKHLIIICSDLARKGPRRSEALRGVCQQENINLYYCLDIDNNFHALPTRRASYILTDAVQEIEAVISQAINDVQPDFVSSHGPVGSYGHGSHRLLFEIVSQHLQVKNLIFTDMCQRSNHRSHDEIPRSVRDAYYRKPFSKETQYLDMNFYHRCKKIYDDHQAWTWSFPPITKANLFIINED